VQKPSGDAAIGAPSGRLRFAPADRLPRTCRPNAAQVTLQFRQNRKTKVAHKKLRRSLHAGKSSEWSALEKPVAANRVRRLPKKFVLWSWRRDSNPRPSDYKSDALPTELRQQFPGPNAPPRKPIPLIPSKCPGQLFKVSQGKVSAQQTLEGVWGARTGTGAVPTGLASIVQFTRHFRAGLSHTAATRLHYGWRLLHRYP
jgi:hypothetical protein